MKYRVWCDEITSWVDGKEIEASSPKRAARKLLIELDGEGKAFPDEEDGDECVICVCEWKDNEDEDGDAPAHETFEFQLSIERRIVDA